MSFLRDWNSLLVAKDFNGLLHKVCKVTKCYYELLCEENGIELIIFKCLLAFLNLDPNYPHNKNVCCTKLTIHLPRNNRHTVVKFIPTYLNHIYDLNEVDSYGNSYMHYLADLSLEPSLKSDLIEKAIGLGSHHFPNGENVTPLQVAAIKGDGACVRTLISKYTTISSAEIIQAFGILLFSTPFQGFHLECRKHFQTGIKKHLPKFRANPTFYLGATMSKETIDLFETIFADIDGEAYTQVQLDYRQSFEQQKQIITNTITPPCGEVASQILQKHEYFSFITIFPVLIKYYSYKNISVRGVCLTTAKPYIQLYQNKLTSLILKRPLPMERFCHWKQLKQHFSNCFKHWLVNLANIVRGYLSLLSLEAGIFMLKEVQHVYEEYTTLACLYLDYLSKVVPREERDQIVKSEMIEISDALLSFYASIVSLDSNQPPTISSLLQHSFMVIHCLSKVKTDTSTNPSSAIVISLLELIAPIQGHQLNLYDDQGRTPLHWAVQKKSEIILFLIESGAYPHAIDKKLKISALEMLRGEQRVPRGARNCFKQLHDQVRPLKILTAHRVAEISQNDYNTILPKDLAYFVYLHQPTWTPAQPQTPLGDFTPADLNGLKLLRENMLSKNQIIYHF